MRPMLERAAFGHEFALDVVEDRPRHLGVRTPVDLKERVALIRAESAHQAATWATATGIASTKATPSEACAYLTYLDLKAMPGWFLECEACAPAINSPSRASVVRYRSASYCA
jgi:hypothetical protein